MEENTPPPIVIRYPEGTLSFQEGKWVASSEDLEVLAEYATALSHPPFYSYSPSDGGWGVYLAHKIAQRLGGTVELPPPPEPGSWKDDPGIVL